MPWNQPGGNGGNPDPWGGKKNPGPPDLDKILGDFIKKVRVFFQRTVKGNRGWQPSLTPNTPNGNSGNTSYGSVGVGVVVLAAVILWFLSGLFIVNPAEQAVVLRLGKFNDVLQPGLHWVARFIDTKYLVDVQKVYSFSLQGDFLTKSSERGDLPNQYIQMTDTDKSKNLVNVELNVQYRIRDPRAYLFNVVNPDNTIQQVASGALSDVVGKMKLDAVLTTGRELLSSDVLKLAKEILISYDTGLEVIGVTLRKVQAPDQVKAAFNDVNRADQDKETSIQQAQAYASKVVPLAQGAAARIQADANAYQQQVVLTAQANVAKYQAILKVYQTSPDITRERMYLESMQAVLSHSSKVLVDVNGANNVLYLPIDKMMQRVKSPAKPVDAEVKP